MQRRAGRHGGVVAAGHPETVRAAVETLERGGNAYDAAVAAGVAASVAEPGLTSLGGGGFLLASTADGEEVLFDFFVETPGRGRPRSDLEPHFTPVTVHFLGADQIFHAGYGSVATPGCLDGYLHVHRRLGRLPLSDVIRPGRDLAAAGVTINDLQGSIFELLKGIFTLTPEGRSLFGDASRFLTTGDRFCNPDLAGFLDEVAQGRVGGFGDAELARAIEQEMTNHAGLVTAADLSAYRVIERDPLTFSYRGARVVTNPPPSFGATLVAEALAQLGSGSPAKAGSSEEVVRIASALRDMSDTHTAQLRSRKGTTHISVADAEGNIAAMTTSNGSCSGVFVPGTGVQLNNIMGEEDLHPAGFHAAPPGERVGSMMAPTILHVPSGEVIALGSGGSERIRSTITQVVLGIIDHHQPLQEVVDAPRMHWDGSTLQVEPGLDPGALEQLRREMPVNVWRERNLYFGGAHAVSDHGDAAGDPRRGGSVAILAP